MNFMNDFTNSDENPENARRKDNIDKLAQSIGGISAIQIQVILYCEKLAEIKTINVEPVPDTCIGWNDGGQKEVEDEKQNCFGA